MEYDLFVEVRNSIEGYIKYIQSTSSAVAELDVLTSFAHVSDKLGYVKPLVDESFELEIVKGRRSSNRLFQTACLFPTIPI